MKHVKNKRGLALENAILFMVIIFSLCTLLTTFAVIGNRRAKIAKETFLERVAIEQIIEDFLADPAFVDGEQGDYTYTVETDGGARTLAVFKNNADGDKILKRTLTVSQ